MESPGGQPARSHVSAWGASAALWTFLIAAGGSGWWRSPWVGAVSKGWSGGGGGDEKSAEVFPGFCGFLEKQQTAWSK